MVCGNGHVQGNGPATAEDEADFGHRGSVLRKKETKEKQKVSKGRFCPECFLGTMLSRSHLKGPKLEKALK